MILTKDNLLRFVREKKYVTPTNVSESFETTTMIGSAALSELSKDKLVAITNIKIGSTPYYYDPKQPESLQDLAEKHYSSYDKEFYTKLKDEEVVNDAALSIQLRLAAQRVIDFANLLEIEHEGKVLKFWIWYLRDLKDTRKQITDILKGKNTVKENKTQSKVEEKSKIVNEVPSPVVKEEQTSSVPKPQLDEDTKSETFIENYFKENYLRIENKNKDDKTIDYNVSLKLNKLKILFDCKFFLKKPNDSDVLKFYSSSVRPKIVFIENAPKKIFKLAENLDNLEIVNI